jgi:hypothetical protein
MRRIHKIQTIYLIERKITKMKKMSFKQIMAAVAAMSLAACAAAIPASAAANGVTVAIDQKEVTVDELKDMNYQVPIFVRLADNAGVNAVEFGVTVDDRCTFSVVSDPFEAMSQAGEMVAWGMTYETNGQLTWQTWAAAKADTKANNIGVILYMVTVPQDAKPGDKYTIDYVKENTKLHIWSNEVDNVDHVAAGTVDFTNGYIVIGGEVEETTTTEATTTTVADTTTGTTTSVSKQPSTPATGSSSNGVAALAVTMVAAAGAAIALKKKD